MEQRPRTIEELKQWYIDKNLPSESVTRFFIGSNYRGAKAFGIYKDESTGKCVVYKNKADGSRSIRYEGMDEAYAVNELYKKLKSEIYNQKNNNPRNYNNRSYVNDDYYRDQGIYFDNSDNYNNYNNYNRTSYRRKSIQLGSLKTILIIYIVIIVLVCFWAMTRPRRGYYSYNDDYYYYQSGSWYMYDDEYDCWDYTVVPDTFRDDCSDYYSSSYYNYSYGISDFEDSIYYESSSSSSDDYDSDYDSSYDYDYDSDYDWDSSSSWDSDYSDWDSDW